MSREKWTGGKEVQRRPADELRQIAIGVLGGSIFVAQDDREIEFCFPVFVLGGLAGAPKSYVDSIGMIFEDMAKAAPMGINGKPMFFSAQMLHKDDLVIVKGYLQKMRNAIMEDQVNRVEELPTP